MEGQPDEVENPPLPTFHGWKIETRTGPGAFGPDTVTAIGSREGVSISAICWDPELAVEMLNEMILRRCP